MATVFVSSVDGNDADSGVDWTNAKATVTGALAIATDATNLIKVDPAHNHSSGAAITWNAPTANSHVAIISTNRTTGAHEAGATETVGVNAAAFSIASSGSQSLFIKGVTCVGNSGASVTNMVAVATAAGASVSVELEGCTLSVPGTQNTLALQLGCANSSTRRRNYLRMRNCTVNTSNSTGANPAIQLRGCLAEINGLTIGFAGANKRTVLFGFFAAADGMHYVFDSDLSGYNTTSGNVISVAALDGSDCYFINCKLDSTPAFVTGSFPATSSGSVTRINVDSADTMNVFEYRDRLGTLVNSTSTYANSGARFAGSGISWEITTTADCREGDPFVTPWMGRWADDTGAVDLDLEILRDSATDYTDRQVWGEFERVSNASFPQGTLATTRNAAPFDGTGVDLTNSSEVWTEAMANDNEMRVRASFTPAEKSLLRGRLVVGVASTVLYLDPAMRITGHGANPAVRWTVEGAYVEPVSAGGERIARLVGGGLVRG